MSFVWDFLVPTASLFLGTFLSALVTYLLVYNFPSYQARTLARGKIRNFFYVLRNPLIKRIDFRYKYVRVVRRDKGMLGNIPVWEFYDQQFESKIWVKLQDCHNKFYLGLLFQENLFRGVFKFTLKEVLRDPGQLEYELNKNIWKIIVEHNLEKYFLS